jgi:ribosomal protein S18 acetylase RimI-like enzyme
MVVQLRAFRKTDLGRCVQLFVDVFSREPWEDQWPSIQRAAAYLSDIVSMPGFKGFIAYEGRTSLGLCFGHVVQWWSGDQFYLDEFCVATGVQRHGIGTSLMEHTRAQLQENGIQFVVLLTEKKTLAERFYLKQGFEASTKTVFMYQRLDGS